MDVEGIRSIGLILIIVFIGTTLLGCVLLLIAAIRLRRLDIPPDATFVETLHYTPLVIVLGIDLLDLGLDILAAPISWIILDWFGLKALRGVAAIEAAIPGTQLLPTLTLCWFGVRILGINS